MKNDLSFDVVVIGGGHAGCEAAAASARLGINTALFTHNVKTIGEMSCNPAIGGLGKGHLVREIDALDGIMGRAIDNSGIQFRMLNLSRGPAVQGPRAQADRVLYKKSIQDIVKKQENLDILEGSVEDIILTNNKLKGVLVENIGEIKSKTLVLTTGTFLRGLIRIGKKSYGAGRVGDKPAINLAKSIERLKFSIGRLKTGTPPRIDKKSINFNDLNEQKPDSIIKPFSFINKLIHIKQISCFLTNTNVYTHEIINNNIHLSPMYSGEIKSMGARYCPSIEDKVRKFSDKNSHQIFLEPEGLESEVIYPNGISTSLPEDVQEEFIHSIDGLQKAKIVKPGYAIEYDYVNPQELYHSLETKKIKNLFFAGQINGTTGYEEAAAQGLIAGMNAALMVQGKESWTPTRDQAYIGVLIDDLITRGVNEPYRMFTSRAEYRLLLREDNADDRLTEQARKLGLICDNHWANFSNKKAGIKKEEQRLKKLILNPLKINKILQKKHLGQTMEREYSAFELLRRPKVGYQNVIALSGTKGTEDLIISEQVEILAKYSGYIVRQKEEIDKQKAQFELKIPKDINYDVIHGLSNEAKQKLTETRPENLAQAARISGVTSSTISILLVFIKSKHKKLNKKASEKVA